MFLARPMREWLRTSGARGRLNAHWGGIARADPSLRDVRVTVELNLGDQRHWVAAVPMTTTSSTDSRIVRRYRPALLDEPDLTSSVEPFQQTAQARTITLRIAAEPLALHTALAQGATLAGIAEISLQRDGDDYDLRLVIMRGEVSAGLDWGENRAVEVQVQVADFRSTQAEQVPRVAVDTDRWPSAADSAVGQRYPYVLNGYPKVPAPLVFGDAANPLYLYLGEPAQNLQADATYVNGELAAGSYAPATDASGVDAKGTRVRYIDFSSSSATWTTDDAVYVDVALASGERSLSAVGVLEHLYRRFTGYGTLGLDLELFARASTRMPGLAPKVLINASGDEGVDVLDFIESTFLPSFPMVHLAYTGLGVGPVVLSRMIGPGGRGAEFRLTGGTYPLISRESDYTESSRDSRYNSFTLRYAYNAMDDSYGGTATIDAKTSPLCALSERLEGRRVADTLDSPLIHSASLARYHLAWKAAHTAVPRYRVTWSAVPAAFLLLRPGMTGYFTDPARSVFTNTHATVVSLTKSRAGCQVTLDVWHPRWKGLALLG
jgi:hypothetical protein